MSNSITVSGNIVSTTDEVEQSYCIVSGYLKDITGKILKGAYITFRYYDSPAAISPNILFLNERIVARSDSNGRVSIKLLQGARVKAEIPNRLLDMIRMCNIPSTTTADLVDILFPRLASVTFKDTTATISVGEEYSIKADGNMSDGEVVDVSAYCTFSSSNTGIATVSSQTATGKYTGTVTLSITSVDTTRLSSRQEPDGDVINISGESEPDITSTMTLIVL